MKLLESNVLQLEMKACLLNPSKMYGVCSTFGEYKSISTFFEVLISHARREVITYLRGQ